LLRSTLLAGGLSLAAVTTATAASELYVSEAADYTMFEEQFCAANRAEQHIFVLPTAIFSQEKGVTCDDGESMFKVAEPSDDPGHLVINIDPPAGSKTAFDCDSKADEGMTIVAINCLPVDQEAATHPKN
jgi:hypothetical protein